MRVEVFKGPGSRKNRVHIFDRSSGSYLTRGYLKDGVLFVKDAIDLKSVRIRKFVR